MTSNLSAATLCAAVLAATLVVFGAAPTPAPATAPSTGPAAAPPFGQGRRGGGFGGGGFGGGGARGGVVVTPLADAEQVEIAPPLDKNGNFKISPKTTWGAVPAVTVKEGVPRGTVTTFSVKSDDTKMYPGTPGRGGAARPYTRDVWVYVPAGYVPGTELPLMVDHDGRATAVIQSNLIAVMDNLIAEKRLPMMAGVFIANGGDVQPNSERSLEYDTVSGKYAEYIENEILPLAEKNGNVKFTKDPDARGVIGQSSGSPAALGMAWFHNEWYHRVISYSGTFVNIQNNADYPRGAWAYHEKLIPQSEKKNLRIWLEVGSRDNSANLAEDSYRNWPIANNHMADALKAKGYDYQFVWAEGAGHVEKGVEQQTLTEAMEWVWKTYKAK
jgi:enterochelin esterase-like enzyme